MRRWPNYAVVGIALMLAGSQVDGQSSNLQILHRFARGTVPSRPVAVAGLPDGTALVLADGTADTLDGVLRVGTDGAIARLGPRPFPGSEASMFVPGADGRYYGLAYATSDDPNGLIWRVDSGGALDTVYRFQGGADGRAPYALFPGPEGTLYGAASAAPGEPESRVFVIDRAGVVTPAVARLLARLVGVGPDGSLYGLNCARGCSLVRQAPSGEETVVSVPLEQASFISVLPLPTGPVLALVDRFYDSQCHLIRIDRPQAASTTLASFNDHCASLALQLDGASGEAVGFTGHSVFRVGATGTVTILARTPDHQGILDVQRGPDGTVWAAITGGVFGGGELFRIPSSGAWTRVVSFPGGNHEGFATSGPLVVDADGFVYGTTRQGGEYGYGTIYRMAKDGTRFQVLYTFTGGNDGARPTYLVKTPDGALWGTTSSGHEHRGTIFRVGRSGALTTVFVFRRTEDGRPPGALAVARDGALYGWTGSGGTFGLGTAFRVTTDGTVAIIHHFSPADRLGGPPPGRPFAAADGHLYGMSFSCVRFSCTTHTLFRMTVRGDVTPIWFLNSLGIVSVPGPIGQTADGRLWGSLSTTRLYAAPTTGGGHIIATNREVEPATVASDGTLYGVVAGGVVKIRPSGEVRPYASVVGVRGSLVDGRDGFLYGLSSSGLLGEIYRLPGPAPDAPPNVRIVR